MKRCPKCDSIKPLSEFSRNRTRYDGVNGWCKSCMKIIAETIRQRESYRIKQRLAANNWRQLPENKEKHRLSASRERLKEPEKIIARRKVRDAISQNRITRQPCSVCGSVTSQAHHENYAKPLEVIWLCQAHHKQLHLQRKV